MQKKRVMYIFIDAKFIFVVSLIYYNKVNGVFSLTKNIILKTCGIFYLFFGYLY